MRKRFQKGYLKKRNGAWIGQWRDNGQHKSETLGRVRDMTKTEALNAISEILRPLNSREATTVTHKTTLEDFLSGIYFPVNQRRWKDSTFGTNKQRVTF